ncbi:MAG: tetratricopeptide repeat protein, partial [Gammaproteobacteria bacterium]
TRGDLDRAEEMFKASLAIFQKLGHQEGMARQYGNLGNIYKTRGELDRAEEMHKKALAIDEKLDRLEGMASTYGNVGSIAKDRGDIARARDLWIQAHDLFAKIGMPHQVERVQGWLDGLPRR